ncbi:LytTR family DNA-binding domain-containing protein [Sphingomonas sp.]|uniref:LytR/AlgR family response regulator transcription factor n=1 Tax=Sphingomonas sp. TaxID=28214 RepID=UPI001822ABC0|nr:LytTR family DNA-binding domain-containing protein [Sphingomonas sp.]MBA3510506.1 LytTR family transcriptional regulator [Sphingomonas sp.]
MLPSFSSPGRPDSEQAGHGSFAIPVLLFWLFTYLTFSFRAELISADQMDVLSIRRLIATGAGACVYWASLSILAHSSGSGGRLIFRVTSWVLLAAALMLPVRLAVEYLDGVAGDVAAISESTRWVLVWAGYFGAWLLAYLLWKSGRLPSAASSNADQNGETAEDPLELLWVQQGTRWLQLPVSDIEWIEADGNYAKVHHLHGSGMLRRPLRALEERLPAQEFVRVHRSALCRRDRISAYVSSGDSQHLVMASGAHVPVSRRHARTVRRLKEGQGLA